MRLPALLAAALAATAATAQPTLSFGQFETGRLRGDDARFSFTASPGDLIEAHVEADFDPTVAVLDPSGNQLAYDDDSGEGVNGYIRSAVVERAGRHTLVVRPYSSGTGEYTAVVRRVGTRGPQPCDSQIPDDLAPGDRVVLGRHRAVGGDDNWADEMDDYVGRETTVRTVTEGDAAGCPTVTVAIDDGAYFWRVRDLSVVREGPLPIQSCGLDLPVDFGDVRLGTELVLGRHRPVDGDDNWAPDMDEYVGRTATVTRLYGTDAAGCGIVSVGIDGGDFQWRVRDAMPAAPYYAIPQACGQTEPYDLGPIEIGSSVWLGRHRAVDGDENWADEMDDYVGRSTTVTDIVGVDDAGCVAVEVAADDGDFAWRVRDLALSAHGAGVPQACEGGGVVDFGPVRVGTQVTLGRHRAYAGDANWTDEMEDYVGLRTTVTGLRDTDPAGCPVVTVEADDSEHYWRVRDLALNE